MKTNKLAKATTHFEQVPVAMLKHLIVESADRIARPALSVPTDPAPTTKRPRRLRRRS